MFYALAKGKVGVPGVAFEHILRDIETLNRASLDGTYEVTAVSYHAYPLIASQYALLSCGSSVGDGYGPIVVVRDEKIQSIRGRRVAVPGRLTTARLALQLFEPRIEEVFMDFDAVFDAVASGDVDAGVVIHEGQITYGDEGFTCLVDLGQWWKDKTGLPLPLGANVIRRDIDRRDEIAGAIKESIVYALNNRRDALDYALDFGRGLSVGDGDRFVSMYVNEYTVDIGGPGREAVNRLLTAGAEAGLIKDIPKIEWVG